MLLGCSTSVESRAVVGGVLVPCDASVAELRMCAGFRVGVRVRGRGRGRARASVRVRARARA